MVNRYLLATQCNTARQYSMHKLLQLMCEQYKVSIAVADIEYGRQ